MKRQNARIVRPSVVLAVAVSLMLSAFGGFAGASHAHAAGTPTSSGNSTTAPLVTRRTLLTAATLYDQTSGASVTATNSQNFEPANAAFNDFTADDFVVPANTTWSLSEIDVLGQYFNGTGPATSVNVFLYNDNAGLPGTQIAAYTSIVPTGGTSSPNFNIPIPATSLTAGTYWVSVQANESFTPNGEWGWVDRSPTANNGAAWSNPGNGFATVCHPGYGRRTTCVTGDLAAPDQAFKILGQVVVVNDLTVTPPVNPVPTFTEGQSQTVIVARFSDPDGNTPGPDYTATINWGDGTTDSCLVTASGNTPACTYGGAGSPGTIQFINCNPSFCDVQGTHTYKEESESGTPYTITTTITDVDQTAQPAPVTTTASVNDAALNGTGGNNGATNGSYSYPGASGCAIFNPCSKVIATFTDTNTFCNTEPATGIVLLRPRGPASFETIGPDGSPHYLITVNYGSGASPATGNVTVTQRGTSCVFDISGSTTYQTPGTKTVTVTITDEGCSDGGTGCSITITSSIDVTVPAPSITLGPITVSSNCGVFGSPGHCPRAVGVVGDPGIWESTTLNAQAGSTNYQGNLNLKDFASGKLLFCTGIRSGTLTPSHCLLHVLSIVCNSTTSATVYGTYNIGTGLIYFRMDVSVTSLPGQVPSGPYMFQDSTGYSVTVNRATNQVRCGP